MEIIVVTTVLVVTHAVVFVGGIAWTRRQLKKDPAKLDALVAQAKDLRDKLRSQTT